MSSTKDSNPKEASIQATINKIRVPGADDPKDPMEVLKIQFGNFSNRFF